MAWADAPAHPPTILVLGDSLSAAFGLEEHQGWVSLLKDRLRQRGFPHEVVNASISGETSSGGLSRLPAALDIHQPSLVILELGANDGLRGLPLKAMTDNLARCITLSQQRGAKVLLIGMRLPPNYGPAYARGFGQTYEDLARQFEIPLMPFLLDRVSEERSLMQADNLHPTAAAQPFLLEAVWPYLEPLL